MVSILVCFVSPSAAQRGGVSLAFKTVTSMANAKQVRARTQHRPEKGHGPGLLLWLCLRNGAQDAVPRHTYRKPFLPERFPLRCRNCRTPHLACFQTKTKSMETDRRSIFLYFLSKLGEMHIAHSNYPLPSIFL